MAEAGSNSQLSHELLDVQPQQVDSKTAKKAIAKAAMSLRGLLKDQEDVAVLVQRGLLADKDTKDVVKGLQEKIGQSPSLIWVLISHISTMPGGEEAAKKLHQGCFPVKNTSQKPKPTPVLHDLKKQLQVLRSMNSANNMIKAAITDAIKKELKFDNAEQIREELSNIYQKALISKDIFKWAITEACKEKKQVAAPSTRDDDTPTIRGTPVELSNDDLYHASLCSTVINKPHIIDTQECKRLLQSSSCRPLIKLSVNQPDDQVEFPMCMIAVYSNNSQGTTCYLAFADFKFQTSTHNPTFGNECERQIKKFPVVYLEKAIKETNRLVLTGFSFGGVLAQMLTAQLWFQPLTNTEVLKSNVICITFGQPLIQSEQLSHVAEIFPDFKDNVHAIYREGDSFPFIAEKIDSLNSTNEVKLENLIYLQECCLDQGQQSEPASFPQTNTNTLNCEALNPRGSTLLQGRIQYCSEKVENDSEDKKGQPENEASALNRGSLKIQSRFEQLFKSQCRKKAIDLTAKRCLIVCGKSDSKTIEVTEEECSSTIDITGLQQHSADIYFKSIKTVGKFDHEAITGSDIAIIDEFLCPIIKQVKVAQYENEAIIVVKGQKLWFVHSVQLSASSTIKDRFQIQPASVSFKASVNDLDIPSNQEEIKVVAFSHFHLPVQAQICVQLDVNGLSPRCRQLAKLEPADLLETAFMTSLLERCRPCHSTNSDSHPVHARPGESSPFFNNFKQFLRQIVTVVPYESLLCAIAQCHNKQKVEAYVRILKQLGAEFPFSLTTYVSVFNIIFKLQHQMTIKDSLFDQLPFEICAYFTWLTVRYNYTKGMLPEAAVNSLSKEIFTDRYMFGFLDSFCDDSLYLREMIQDSLKQVNSLSEVEAVSCKSAASLYNLNSVHPSDSKQGSKNLKSPIKVIREAREALNQSNDGSALQETNFYEKILKVLQNARYVQIELCINILCCFIHQHVQVPFTEVNPMSVWKRLIHILGPYTDVFKSDSEYWTSMLKRCQRAISKGSEVAERTYRGKLLFLVTTIDLEAKAQTTLVVSEYTLEKKLKEICSSRGINAETSVEQIVLAWQKHFKDCPIANVTPSHHSLISRWIKWSLMIHELRLTLEKHITIIIPGLVNSGKTQLIRSLFGFNVKAGTTEQRRTIVPFMYSLAPDVEGVHIVDLPGADDSDKNVLQFTEFLNRISQVVIFVVSYDKAHTKDAIQWLNTFDGKNETNKPHGSNSSPKDKDSRPILVCMTFTDRLLAEMMGKDGRYDKLKARREIKRHFEEVTYDYYGQSMWTPAGPNGKRTLGCYSFDLSRSVLGEGDMRSVNIGVPSDVGVWLCQQLREELCASDTADQLEAYFKNSDSKL